MTKFARICFSQTVVFLGLVTVLVIIIRGTAGLIVFGRGTGISKILLLGYAVPLLFLLNLLVFYVRIRKLRD